MDKDIEDTVVILAGGLGTRLREVVKNVPKPMAPIGGKPFLEYLMDYWVENNTDRFVLSVGYKHEQIQDYFGSEYKNRPITYVIEAEPLGTGGAILNVIQNHDLDESFFLINGDTYFSICPSSLKEMHFKNKADFTMSLRQAVNADRYHHMVLKENGKILSISSDYTVNAECLINGGVYYVNKDVFDNGDTKKQFLSLENDMLPEIINRREAYGLVDAGKFIDIGVPEDYLKAQKILKDNISGVN